jgi:hypothetical protein
MGWREIVGLLARAAVIAVIGAAAFWLAASVQARAYGGPLARRRRRGGRAVKSA